MDEGRGFHGLLADLSGLQHSIVNPDSFVDPSILEVNWGHVSEPDGKGGLRWVEGAVDEGRGFHGLLADLSGLAALNRQPGEYLHKTWPQKFQKSRRSSRLTKPR